MYDHTEKNVSDAMGISKERYSELLEIAKTANNETKTVSHTLQLILERCITEQEIALMCYMFGIKHAEIEFLEKAKDLKDKLERFVEKAKAETLEEAHKLLTTHVAKHAQQGLLTK